MSTFRTSAVQSISTMGFVHPSLRRWLQRHLVGCLSSPCKLKADVKQPGRSFTHPMLLHAWHSTFQSSHLVLLRFVLLHRVRRPRPAGGHGSFQTQISSLLSDVVRVQGWLSSLSPKGMKGTDWTGHLASWHSRQHNVNPRWCGEKKWVQRIHEQGRARAYSAE